MLLFKKDEQYILTYGDEHPEEFGDYLKRELKKIQLEKPDVWTEAHTLLVKMIKSDVRQRITLKKAMIDNYFAPLNQAFIKRNHHENKTHDTKKQKSQSETMENEHSTPKVWAAPRQEIQLPMSKPTPTPTPTTKHTWDIEIGDMIQIRDTHQRLAGKDGEVLRIADNGKFYIKLLDCRLCKVDGRYLEKKTRGFTTIKFVKVAYKGGAGIRKGPEYPGEMTGEGIQPEETVAYIEKKIVKFHNRIIFFYKLADGQGWIHNYNPSSEITALKEID